MTTTDSQIEIKVSIIIPVYNVEKYLRACLDSVIHQTLREIEIICVNDGSTDTSPAILAEYSAADPRIRIIDRVNGGLSAARNSGISAAMGQYLYFLDSDDYIDSNAVELCCRAMDENKLDLLIFNGETIFENENLAEKFPQFKDYYHRTHLYPGVTSGMILFASLVENDEYRTQVSLQMVRRLFLSENNIRFHEGIIHEDNLYSFVCFMQASRAMYIENKFFYRRVRDESIMTASANRKSAIGYWVFIVEMIGFIQEKTYEERVVSAVERSIRKSYNILLSKLRAAPEESLGTGSAPDTAYYHLLQHLMIDQKMRDHCEIRRISKELEDTKGLYEAHRRSVSYRVGRAITFLPRKIKHIAGRADRAWKFLRRRNKRCCYLIDTPNHRNIGDIAIAVAEREMLKSALPDDAEIVEMTTDAYFRNRRKMKLFISRKHMIFCSGGGNMGVEWFSHELLRRDAVQSFPKNRIVILPQTIYFGDNDRGADELRRSADIYAGHSDLHIVAREKTSFDIMNTNFHRNHIYLAPDMVLSMDLTYPSLKIQRSGILLCMRNDCEKRIENQDMNVILSAVKNLREDVSYTDTILPGRGGIPADRQENILLEFVSAFRKSRIVITDRMHGMLFCAITGTPCIAFPNYNHKLSGSYEWIRSLKYIYFMEDTADLEQRIDILLGIEPELCCFERFTAEYEEVRGLMTS